MIRSRLATRRFIVLMAVVLFLTGCLGRARTVPGGSEPDVYGRITYAVPSYATGVCTEAPPKSFGTNLMTPPADRETGSSEVIVELTAPPAPEVADRLMQATGAPGYRIAPYIDLLILEMPAGATVEAFIRDLLAQPEVVDAYPNEQVMLLAEPVIPDDTCYAVQHHLHQVNAPLAWSVTTGDADIVVAVLDTGVDVLHPDLHANLLPGWNAYDGSDDVRDSSALGHGTHVSGIVGAVTHNGQGVAGMAWNVRILPVKVLDDRSGQVSEVAAGIRYAVDAGADIINMSLGIPYDHPVVREAIEYADAQGVLLVAAAGNTGMGLVTTAYPARYPEVIGVGSTAKHAPTDAADFSLRGPGIDVVAPGEDVWSTIPSGYGRMRGTSMATPVVSGVAALMLAQGIPPSAVRDVLHRTAVRIGEPTFDTEALHTVGYGLVNAYAAVLKLDLRDAVVFAMDGNGVVHGETTSPDSERRFALTRLPAQEGLHLIGWLDANGNGTLDAGDYFGTVPFASETALVDLHLSVVPRDGGNELVPIAAEAIMKLGLGQSALP